MFSPETRRTRGGEEWALHLFSSGAIAVGRIRDAIARGRASRRGSRPRARRAGGRGVATREVRPLGGSRTRARGRERAGGKALKRENRDARPGWTDDPRREGARARPPVAGRRSSLAARRGSPFLGLSPPRVRARARAFATPRAAGPRASRRRDHPRVSRAVANPAGSLDLARSRREFARPRWPPTRKDEAPIPRHPVCAASLEKTNNPNPRLSSVRSTDLKRIPPPNVPPTRS